MNEDNRAGKPVSKTDSPSGAEAARVKARRSSPPSLLASALEKAQALFEEASRCFPDGAVPPFDPKRYAEMLGIPVASSSRMPNWDALLIPGAEGFRILYNSTVRSEGRKRFSIAHEIAHTLFPDAAAAVRRRAKREDYETAEEIELERWCDKVAAELLMPEPVFQQSIDEFGAEASAIPALAERFEVSLSASAVRFVEMSEEPCAVAVFEWMHRPKLEKMPIAARRQVRERRRYRVREIYQSQNFPRMFAVGKSVPDDSVVYRASLGRGECAAEERYEGRREDRVLRASAFPMHRGAMIDEPPRVCAIFRV